MGGGGGSSKPTAQQQQLETFQATQNANLNLEENAQRKALLNAIGTRVFRGSALSRALRGNAPGTGGNNQQGAPSKAQLTASSAPITPAQSSLLDVRQSRASGATTSGGTGASASAAALAASAGAYTGAAGAGMRIP